MRCGAHSRVLEPMASAALLSPRERIGRSKVYIRPIQADLVMTAIKTEFVANITYNHSCCKDVPLSSLREHVVNCPPR